MKKLLCVVMMSLCVVPILAAEEGILSTGLQVYSTLEEFTAATGQEINSYHQAPLLQARVDSGDLPPLEERLPVEPLVIDPMEEIGTYGGRLVGSTPDPKGWGRILGIFQLDGLMRVGTDNSTPIPNVAKDVHFSADGKEVTIFLREGMKWSDGVPFTADDLVFTWEDLLLHEELALQTGLSPQKSYYSPTDDLPTITKIDDYTVRFDFPVPHPLFRSHLTWEAGIEGKILFPKHYFEKWHIKYNPDADQLAQDAGHEHWYQLFPTMADVQSGPHNITVDYPTLRPYVLREKTAEYMIAERNPYYWKVDSAGNQLPYIDELMVMLNVTEEVEIAKILDGEIGYAGAGTDDLALLKENEAAGNYRALVWQSAWGSQFSFHVNQTYNADMNLQEIFRDKRFRQALSLAINRAEINDVVLLGLGVATQVTVAPETSYFEQSFADAFAAYDPEGANALLDEMGLDQRDSDNIRLRKDGKKLELLVEVSDSWFPISLYELVEEYWDALGIDVTMKTISPQLIFERYPSNEVQIGGWASDSCTEYGFVKNPNWWVPAGWPPYNNIWPLWLQWAQSGGEKGEEPIAEVQANMDAMLRMQTAVTDEGRISAAQEILRSQAENLWSIGTVGFPPEVQIVRGNLRNVPEQLNLGDGSESFSCPETYFLK